MKPTVTITRGEDGEQDGIRFGDGTFVGWSDFAIDEPLFDLPRDVKRIEYIPGERLSFFTDDTQFGLSGFTGTWEAGDRFILRKDEYVANAVRRVPPPPPPPPMPASAPVNTKVADAKVAIDTYLADPLADPKLKMVLAAIRGAF